MKDLIHLPSLCTNLKAQEKRFIYKKKQNYILNCLHDAKLEENYAEK